MSLIGDISDPKKDAAAIEPVLDELEAKLVDAVVARRQEIADALDGGTDGN